MSDFSDPNRKLLFEIESAIGMTSDVVFTEKISTTTPDYARGYIAGFCKYADDDLVMLGYFVLELLKAKISQQDNTV